MAIEPIRLERLIRDGVPDASIRLEDTRGDGEHYSAFIISPAFRGLNRVQQHQMVYGALKSVIDRELHALSLRTATPEEAAAHP